MTVHDITAYSADYQASNASAARCQVAAAPGVLPPAALTHPCVSEPPSDYDPRPVDYAEFPEALRRIRRLTERRIAYAQIGRVLRLADLLDSPEAQDRPAEVLAGFAQELREAAILLEEAVCHLARPVPEDEA